MPDDGQNGTQGQQGAQGGNGSDAQGQSETPASWDAWLQARPEAERAQITALYDAQTSGLKTALESERETRKGLEKQVRELAKGAEAGSKAQEDLNALADQLAGEQRRADFYEAAAKPETGLTGVKAAWVLMNAEADRYFDRRGNPNFDLLRQEHPYLFGQKAPTPKGNQGNGTQGQTPTGQSMNDMIRRAAGRQ